MKHKIGLSVDIEDWYHIPSVTGSDFSFYPDVHTFMNKWEGRYDYLTEPTKRVLGHLKHHNLKATFFIVSDIAEYYEGLIEAVMKDGHEIACHGLHHAMNLNTRTKSAAFTKDEFEDRTGKSREILQRISGQKVNGYRAPGAYIGEWMFDSLINLGFDYDSSVNPNSFIKKTDFNLKPISSVPYKIKSTISDKEILELPWPYFNFFGFRFPTAGGPFLRFMPSYYIKQGLSASQKRGHTVFYFHSTDLSYEKLPALASKNSKRPFWYITSGKKTESKMLKILDSYKESWATCGEIAELLNQ